MIGTNEDSGKTSAECRTLWIFALLPVLAVVLFYLAVLGNDFVNYDDRQTITENLFIRSLNFSSLHWMLTTNFQGYWVPLTWFSLALNYWMAGLNPKVFHLTNLFFHALNTLLVFLVCLRVLNLAKETRRTEKRPGQMVLIWPPPP